MSAVVPEGHNIFVVDLHYLVPFAQIEPLIDAHMGFLENHYAQGHFLASGRKEPRTGGVILAIATKKSDVETWIKDDPFHQAEVASYTITEFVPGMLADCFSEQK